MSTKDIVQAIADSIVNEVEGADDWTIQMYQPIWKNPKSGSVLSVYRFDRFPVPTEYDTTGYRFDNFTFHVEYAEATGSQSKQLKRDEDAELDLSDRGDAMVAWADSHENLPPHIEHMKFGRLLDASALRRELFTRGFQLVLNVIAVAAYE